MKAKNQKERERERGGEGERERGREREGKRVSLSVALTAQGNARSLMDPYVEKHGHAAFLAACEETQQGTPEPGERMEAAASALVRLRFDLTRRIEETGVSLLRVVRGGLGRLHLRTVVLH